jgi:hypothetical protein
MHLGSRVDNLLPQVKAVEVPLQLLKLRLQSWDRDQDQRT